MMVSKLYKELKKLYIKHPNNLIKMGINLNRILNREITNGTETLKEMFDILSHQENANENNF